MNETNRIDGYIMLYRGEHDPTKSDKALDFDWAELQENAVKGYIESQENHWTSTTPPKFNMKPENDGFQKESPFPGTSFQVPC